MGMSWDLTHKIWSIYPHNSDSSFINRDYSRVCSLLLHHCSILHNRIPSSLLFILYAKATGCRMILGLFFLHKGGGTMSIFFFLKKNMFIVFNKMVHYMNSGRWQFTIVLIQTLRVCIKSESGGYSKTHTVINNHVPSNVCVSFSPVTVVYYCRTRLWLECKTGVEANQNHP